MKKLLMATLLCCCFFYSRSQTAAVAPTLQAGLSGLKLTKGTLDQELIMEIISEKQEEIKEKLITNMLLRKLDSAGSTVYSYVNNTLDIIRKVKEPEVRTKAIIENTVNLTIITTFALYYMEIEANNPDLRELKTVFLAGRSLPPGLMALSQCFSWYDTKINSNDIETFSLDGSEPVTDGDDKKQEVNEFMLTTRYVNFLVDLSSLIIKENEGLKRLGIYQSSNLNTYDGLNAFFIYQDKNIVSESLALRIKNSMAQRLDQIMKYAGLMAVMEKMNNVHFDFTKLRDAFKTLDLSNERLEKFITRFYQTTKENLNEINRKDLNAEIINHTAVGVNIEINQDFKVYKKDVGILLAFISKINTINFKGIITKPEVLCDLLYEINFNIIPSVNRIATYNPKSVQMLGSMDTLSCYLLNKIDHMASVFTNDYFKQPFSHVVAKLYQFGEATTFSSYLTILTDLGKMFKNEDIQNALQIVTAFTNRYIKIKKEEEQEKIDFDVEGMLVAFRNITYNRSRMIEFNLTVGMNSGIFNKPFYTNGGDTLSGFSFVSEKVGVKFKIRDMKFLNSFNRSETFIYRGTRYVRKVPPRQPLIDNVHVLAYGSGILYNIVNAKTNKTFTYPIAGAGLGLTFFNSLDFNISIAKPIVTTRSEQLNNKGALMLNFGFDIQFTEYMDRLAKKRKEAKQQKQITEILSHNH